MYPPREEKKKLENGKEIDLSEEKYINRLWQFVEANFEPKTSKSILKKDFEQLGNKIENIYHLQCKGVHSDISKLEAEQVMTRTYQLLGDLIRIRYDIAPIETPKTIQQDKFNPK